MHGGAEIIGGGIKQFAEVSNYLRRGFNDSQRYQIIRGGIK